MHAWKQNLLTPCREGYAHVVTFLDIHQGIPGTQHDCAHAAAATRRASMRRAAGDLFHPNTATRSGPGTGKKQCAFEDSAGLKLANNTIEDFVSEHDESTATSISESDFPCVQTYVQPPLPQITSPCMWM